MPIICHPDALSSRDLGSRYGPGFSIRAGFQPPFAQHLVKPYTDHMYLHPVVMQLELWIGRWSGCRQVPNLLRIAIHAFMKDQALWQTTVYKVQQKNIKRLPQSTIVLLQPAIARAIDRESKFEEKSSEELLLIFAMRINHYFGFSLLKGADASLKFLLRLGCVLMNLGELRNDPQIAKIIRFTVCNDKTKNKTNTIISRANTTVPVRPQQNTMTSTTNSSRNAQSKHNNSKKLPSQNE